jgi:BlaI family transcriptional regulator, penicillinase repressor
MRDKCRGTEIAHSWNSDMPKRALDRLTRREREIVNVLFALGNSATVEDVRGRLDTPPSDSSVRVMLGRLELKGVVRREQQGIKNVYSVSVSPTAAKRTALRQYLDTFFGGSLRLMLSSLVREGSWTEDDLEFLRGEIERARKERARR